MKVVKHLIQLHKFLFITSMVLTLCSVFLNLFWNNFLAHLLDRLREASSFQVMNAENALSRLVLVTIVIILLLTASECLSSFLASYLCELFAHEMRMSYAGFYLRSDIRTLFRLNAGEEQSAMQNEMSEVSTYLNENLFSLTKQCISFVFTVVFLFYQNPKLTLFTILPVAPLIIYCSRSSQVIKKYTEQCQEGKKEINGLSDILLELFPVIQVYGAYKLIDTVMRERLLEWQTINIKKERIAAALMSLSGLLSFVPLLLLVGIGGFMVINSEMTLGIFYIFINLSGNVSGFLQNMPGIYAGFRRFSASLGRLEEKLVL
uniref:ABC transporter transmembrane domain-containing protein n=1 Tax=Acetatifactor sp. TaxID=1872090 RepID=UPI0040572CE2